MLSISTYAQSDSLYLNIKWIENQQVYLRNNQNASVLAIENGISRQQTGSLPWFVTSMQSDEFMSPSHINVEAIEIDTLSFNLQDTPLDISLIPNAFEWKMIPFEIGSKIEYALQILPLRNNNGIIERMLKAKVTYIQEITRVETDVNPTFATQSVLSAGTWIKMGITEDGVYKLSYNDLVAMGLNPDQIDPQQIGIYGNGGRMVPEKNSDFRYDDLFENAILVKGEADGHFNADDYVLFYGESTTRWKYNQIATRFAHITNYYSDTSYYFLTVNDQGTRKRIENKAQSENTASREVAIFLDRVYHENDLENLIISGKEWFGEEFTKSHPEKTFGFNFQNRVNERPVYFNMHFAGRSISESIYFSAEANDQLILDKILLLELSANNTTYARDSYQAVSFFDIGDQIDINVSFQCEADNSKGWLNFLTLNAWRQLKYTGNQLMFRNPETVAPAAISQFTLSNCNTNVYLWDITSPLSPKNQLFTLEGSQLNFKVLTDTLREFALFDLSNTKSIANYITIANQNLHSITAYDMIIVAHPEFIESANELADIHLVEDGIESIVVDINEIYNEFGSGMKDISAVRDFVRMVFLRGNQRLKYLLLFGDASYDYKDKLANNTNFVPTYQATNSLVETQSFLSDDYFGLMGFNEGLEMDGILDIGIGRFPVKNKTEANNMVNKIKHYLINLDSQFGDWTNNITFVADDGDSNLHLTQAETLAAQMDTTMVSLNVKKIYLDTYKRISVPGGYRYPGATDALLHQINEGSLIINYTGHGGITGLSDEKVFTITHIEALQNFDRLPFFITATCEFSRFDNPDFVSAGELLLLNPHGGSIAMMTTTRLAFSHSNFALNRRLYASMFSPDDKIYRLGDIIKLSKNPTSAYVYNFALLGDPALKLKFPENKIEITEFNSRQLPAPADTLGAMAEVNLKGTINDGFGNILEDFNGIIYPKMFDKRTNYKTLANDPSSQVTLFNYFDKLLYKGKVSVINGHFELNYKLPKDIAFQFGKAKISLYATDTITFEEVGGYFNSVFVGGTDTSVEANHQGPIINLYANEPGFTNGEYSSVNPVIYIQLEDPQGIHHLGTSIGRDIVLTHTSKESEHLVINEFFQPAIDNFAAGTIVYPMKGLGTGHHTITVKAWDLHNNSSETEIWFVVNPNAAVSIQQLRCNPNPFSSETKFVFEHNKPGELIKVQIDIYDRMGMWITQLNTEMQTSGALSEPINWDGRAANGVKISNGLYVYRVTVSDVYSNSTSVNQRFIFIGN